MPWCPKCRAEFREGFTECNTCHVPLLDVLPEEQPEQPVQPDNQPEGIDRPIAVYMAQNRLEAETVCDMLRDNGVAAFSRPADRRQMQAYLGADARFGLEILVGAEQTAAARALIDEMKTDMEATPPDEEELARLAEEQALETPPQPVEDNTSFRLIPVAVGVIAVALLLLYFVTR